MSKEYKWHFAKTGGSDEEGLEDAGLSYFKSDPHHYIARETIQNSLDAKDESPELLSATLSKFDIRNSEINSAPRCDKPTVPNAIANKIM